MRIDVTYVVPCVWCPQAVDREYDAVRRFHNAKTTLELFEQQVSHRQYKDASLTLPPLVELLEKFFGPYAQIGAVRTLITTFEASKKELFGFIYADFKEYSHDRDQHKAGTLNAACLALDAMGGTFKQQLVDWFLGKQVEGYAMAFAPNMKGATFEFVDKRFDLWKDIAKSFKDHWHGMCASPPLPPPSPRTLSLVSRGETPRSI